MNKALNYFVFLIIIFCSIHFWRPLAVPPKIFNITDLIGLSLIGIWFLRIKEPLGNTLFSKYLLFLLIGIFINILTTYYFQGQTMFDSFVSFGPYYFIFIYFFLLKADIDRESVEKFVIFFGLLYIVVHFIQFLAYPTALFKTNIFMESRGTIRFKMEGNAFLSLLYFYSLNKYLTKLKIIYLIVTIVCFIIFFMQGFRTLLVLYSLGAIILMFRLVKIELKHFVYLGLLIGGIYLFSQNSYIKNIYKNQVETSVEQADQGKDYIRILELNYFTGDFVKNNWLYFWGSGLSNPKSDYGKHLASLEDSYNLYWVDIGLIGFYIMMGAIITISLISLTIKAWFSKCDRENQYLGIFFIFLFFSSFTTVELFRSGSLGTIGIALYLIEKSKIRKEVETNAPDDISQLNADNK